MRFCVGLALLFAALCAAPAAALDVDSPEFETGASGDVAPFDQVSVDTYHVIQYVLVRESYDSTKVRLASEMMASLSAAAVRSDYQKLHDGPKGRDRALGRRARIAVTLVSIELSAGSRAVVRFETRKIHVGSAEAEPARQWVATVEYTYLPVLLHEEDGQINPWGFRVTRYRVDPDSVAAREDAP